MPPGTSTPREDAAEETVRLSSLIRANVANLWSNIGSGMKALGDWRDGLLPAAGALYLLGYMSWAWYRVANGIGFIPVFDAQYFVAGVVPAVLICLFLVGVRILRAINGWLKYPPTRLQTKVAKFLTVCDAATIFW